MSKPPCTKRLYRPKLNHTSILVKLYKANNRCYFDLEFTGQGRIVPYKHFVKYGLSLSIFSFNNTGVRFSAGGGSGVRITKLMNRGLSDFTFCHVFAGT